MFSELRFNFLCSVESLEQPAVTTTALGTSNIKSAYVGIIKIVSNLWKKYLDLQNAGEKAEFGIIIKDCVSHCQAKKFYCLLILLVNFLLPCFSPSPFQLIIDYGDACSCSLISSTITESLCLLSIKGEFLMLMSLAFSLDVSVVVESPLPEKTKTQKPPLPGAHHQIYTDSSLIELNIFLFGNKNDLLGAIFFSLSALKPAAITGLAFPGTH